MYTRALENGQLASHLLVHVVSGVRALSVSVTFKLFRKPELRIEYCILRYLHGSFLLLNSPEKNVSVSGVIIICSVPTMYYVMYSNIVISNIIYLKIYAM